MFFRKSKVDIAATLAAQAEHIHALECSYQAIMSRYDQQLSRLDTLENYFLQNDSIRRADIAALNRYVIELRLLDQRRGYERGAWKRHLVSYVCRPFVLARTAYRWLTGPWVVFEAYRNALANGLRNPPPVTTPRNWIPPQ